MANTTLCPICKEWTANEFLVRSRFSGEIICDLCAPFQAWGEPEFLYISN